MPSSQPWPTSGSMHSGRCYQRKPLAPRISASGFSFWPTTNTMDSVGAARHGYMNDGRERAAVNRRRETLTGHAGTTLTDAIRAWPTPTSTLGTNGGLVTPRKSRQGGTLIEAVSDAMWPTASARDGDSRRCPTKPDTTAWKNKVSRGAVNAAEMLSDDLSSSASAWQSPQTSDANGPRKPDGKRSLGLNTQPSWATPNARDHKGRDLDSRNGGASLAHQAQTGEFSHSSRPVLSTHDGRELSPTDRTLRPRLLDALTRALRDGSWVGPKDGLEMTG